MCMVPTCCLDSTSNKEHTLNILRGRGGGGLENQFEGMCLVFVEKHFGAKGVWYKMYQHRTQMGSPGLFQRFWKEKEANSSAAAMPLTCRGVS